jgi:LysM repeat protein
MNTGKPNFRLFVITIVAVHGVFFAGLLLQGCKPRTEGPPGGGVTAQHTNELQPLTNPAPYGAEASNALAGSQPTPTNGVPGAGQLPPQTQPQPQPQAAVPPAGSEPVVPAGPTATTEYLVKPGDTPAKIAKAQGVPLLALMNANPGLEPRKLQIGQKLQVPAPGAGAKADAGTPFGAAAASPDAAALQVHVVKRGENLTRIAKRYGVSIADLRAANNLKTDRINAGQKLGIPASKAKPSATPAPAPAPGATAAESQPLVLPPAASGTMAASNPPPAR